MYLRCRPFNSRMLSMFKAVIGEVMDHLDIPEIKMSEEAYSFCKKCLVVDPVQRLSTTELLQCHIIKSATPDKDFETTLQTIFLTLSLHNSGI